MDLVFPTREMEDRVALIKHQGGTKQGSQQTEPPKVSKQLINVAFISYMFLCILLV